jgi:gliding motility-associated-like protein
LGWDGKFNEKTMPADDYWYNIQLEDGRSTRGHFTLKR